MTTTPVLPDTRTLEIDERFEDLDGSVRSYGFRQTVPIGDGNVLEGYAAVFDQPTRINNWEGDFVEVVRKGAFAKAIRQSPRPKVMFEHGKHPFIGSMPIASLETMREDDHGLFVRAVMFRNVFTEGIIHAINGQALDDMSFRFVVPQGGDRWSEDRYTRELVRDLEVPEFGPVVWGAYSGTSVTLRSQQFLQALQDDEIRRDLSLAFLLDPAKDLPVTETVRTEVPAVEETRETETNAGHEEAPAESDSADPSMSSAPNLARRYATLFEVSARQALTRSTPLDTTGLPID